MAASDEAHEHLLQLRRPPTLILHCSRDDAPVVAKPCKGATYIVSKFHFQPTNVNLYAKCLHETLTQV